MAVDHFTAVILWHFFTVDSGSVLMPHRSDIVVWVHGGSPEGRMGHEPAEVGHQRQQLGHAEGEVTVISHLVGSPPTAFCFRLTDRCCLVSPCWASGDMVLELNLPLHGWTIAVILTVGPKVREWFGVEFTALPNAHRERFLWNVIL